MFYWKESESTIKTISFATTLVCSKGHLEILAAASRNQHRHWNWHWHWHCKNFIFAFRSCFETIEDFCSFLCLVMASVPP